MNPQCARCGKIVYPTEKVSCLDTTCAAELGEPLQRVFNLSLELGKVPTLWKTSCIIPVPKKNRPSELNDFRPVALTSHLMKTLERLFLNLLRPQVQHAEDSLQFAYRDKVGVEDAIIYLLHRVHSHLDKGSGTARILFLDFLSAFNTIQSLVLQDNLLQMRVDPCLVAWISSYLTDRPQFVRMKDTTSDTVVSSISAPQGTMLSPILFTLYTSDFCYNSEMCHIQKFADDTAIVGCIRDDEEEEYRCLVRDFVAWCHNNSLQLNTSKTKELVIDFGRDRPRPRPVQIGTEEVEGVQTYKYLGLWLDNRLDWTSNTRQLYKKTQSRMYFLRRLRSFNICRKLLWMFYQSVVASVLSYAVVCWGGECDKSGPLQAGEADQAGQLGGGDETETSGDSGREENY
ncbi:putative RNA-directed DNA polymerase from transposon BS [Takifugu flavidus]|uniref:Putative RNA-directed DNA polymerase from transposon BS n=1 Tax=Takifugu flavidus TaxID=433684 RepID=A0A5C6MFL9_9TELE|nr:putative RNA-directed DNA polymerase from transposon BS [Takifugu flavidus]